MRFAGAKLRKKTEVFYDSDRAIFIFISFFQLADFRSPLQCTPHADNHKKSIGRPML